MCVMFMKDIKTGTYYEVWKKYKIKINDISLTFIGRKDQTIKYISASDASVCF